jgi:hypothetical protein
MLAYTPPGIPTAPGAVLTSSEVAPRHIHGHRVLQLPDLQLTSLEGFLAGRSTYPTRLPKLLKLNQFKIQYNKKSTQTL